MKKGILLIIMIGFTYTLFADSIKLKDERVFDGIIIGKRGNVVYINTGDSPIMKYFAIDRDTIDQIIDDDNQLDINQFFLKQDFSNGFDLNNLSNYSHIRFSNTLDQNKLIITKGYKNEIRTEYIILSVAFGFLAWDYFAEASDISELISNLDNGTDTSKLRKTLDRKIITGLALSASSVFSFIASFEKVEVKATPNSINMSYNF